MMSGWPHPVAPIRHRTLHPTRRYLPGLLPGQPLPPQALPNGWAAAASQPALGGTPGGEATDGVACGCIVQRAGSFYI